MANLQVRDAGNNVKYLSMTGAGSDVDPMVPQQAVTTTAAVKTMTWLTNTTATAGDNAIIAAPGLSTRIVVSTFVLQNETTTANTLILKDGATAKFRTLAQNQGDGIARTFPPGYELRLTANTALNLNLSAAFSVGYNVAYFTEAC